MKKLLTIGLFVLMAALLFAGQIALKDTGTRVVPVAKYLNAPLDASIPAHPSNLPLAGTRDPNTLDEVIISEGFEGFTNWELPAGWTQVDVDQGYCTQFTHNSTWGAYNYGAQYAHAGTGVLFNMYNDNALPNNDWCILPVQNLQSPITLSYWVASQDPLYLESYEVKVSTTGAQPADFTNLIYSQTNVPTTWAQHTLDLSAYAGAPMYIAFHYNATDKFVIKIDDLLLEAGAAGPHGSISGTVTDSATTNPLAGAVVAITGGATDTTDAQGHYFFETVTPDTFILTFSASGYTSRTDSNVVVLENDTTVVNAALAPHGGGGTEVINEGFEGLTNWELPAGWAQVDVDQGYCTQFTHNSTWGAYNYGAQYAHGGTGVLFNCYNDNALPNNDWAVFPQMNLTGTITLTYWVASQDPLYLESYEVKVSTTGTQPANFTNLVYSQTSVPTTWTQHTLDLSSYAGAPFYIAFHYNATDKFVIKIDDVVLTGEPVAVNDNPAPAVQSFAFEGNYPNPFNAQTEFRFSIPRTSPVELTLYNVVGQEVARIVNGPMNAGTHTVAFDAAKLPSGLYFARLNAAGMSATHKVMLLK